MKVLITGGAGFIGSNFVRAMLSAGYEVLNVDCLTYAGNLGSLCDVAYNPNYHFAKVDIADACAIRDTILSFRPSVVVHLAAESHVDRSIDGPLTFIKTNVLGTFNLLQTCLEYWQCLPSYMADSFRFLHVSTDEVYGSLGADGWFTEATAYDPRSPYSASKASSDHLVRAWHHTYGLPTIITNCSNNYGPYQFPEKLVPLMILNALDGKPLPVYGHGSNVRDWLYVEDHCRAIRLVLEVGQVGEVYNIGGNCEYRNLEVVHMICDLMDELRPNLSHRPCRSLISFVQDRPGHDLRYAMDTTKLQSTLGWQPLESFQSGLRRTVEWYLVNTDWVVQVTAGKYQRERLGLAKVAQQ